MLRCDMGPAYRFHQRVIKLLQWRRPPSRWRLKTPLHMFGLDALVEVYPQAKFVMTHRDPATVIPSVATLVDALAPPNTLDPAEWRRYLGTSLTDRWVEATHRLVEFRDRVGDKRFFDLRFAEVMTEPLAAMDRLYSWLGEDLTPDATAAMAAWIERNEAERAAVSPMVYRAEDYGLTPGAVRDRFSEYLQRFPIAGTELRMPPR